MKFTVRFLPEDRSLEAKQPMELMLAAMRCDIWLEQPCGAKQTCGKCRVRVREGKAAVTAADRTLLTREEIADGWRLGCTLVLRSSATIEAPETVRSVAGKPFGDALLFATGFQPNVAKRSVDWKPPTHGQSELDALARALGVESLAGDDSMLADLPARLPARDARVTAVYEGQELLEIESGDTSGRAFGVAFDLGTTTLAAALVNLCDGQVLEAVSRLNPQARFGADVISRIRYAQEHAGGTELHECLREAMGQMVGELAARAGVRELEIYSLALAGNTTMTHAALGADLRALGEAPYLGRWTEERTVCGRALGLPVHPRARVRFLPMVRSHVGGDAVAAALAVGLDRSEGARLLVDLGTNSELMLGCRGKLLAASTAAGPAFEGGNIGYGMRAEPGAIDAVRVSPGGELTVKTIDDQPARGLCGSGLVDAVAELLRAGVILPSGYLKSHEQMTVAPPTLREHCRRLRDGQHGVLLAGTVVLSAHDVRQLQLAKGAIRAAAELLLRHAGLAAGELEEVNIAGTFGNFLRKASLVALGLVPEIDPERVRFVGNAAGVGARMVLVDAEARRRALEIAQRCEYVELAGHPEYEAAFVAALAFPSGKR